MNPITRLEIIGVNGREIVHYSDMEYSIQDNGRTLKVFIKPEHEDKVLPMATEKWFQKAEVKDDNKDNDNNQG